MLIDELRRRQGILSDAHMAGRLGVSRSMWRQVIAGETQPGRAFLAGVMAAYPDLAPEVLMFLRDDPPEAPQTVQETQETAREGSAA